jgi:uncharacterized membrane protein
MNQLGKTPLAKPDRLPSDNSRMLHWFCFALFLISLLLVWAKTAFAFTLPGTPGWAEIILIFTATAATLVSVSRQLPAQNILLAAAVIAVIAGGAEAIGVLTGIPFGPFIYTAAVGPKLFGVLPWCVPLLWIVSVFTSRGVARLILRPWRKSRLYGFRLIGLTAALAVVFDFGLEPFATRVGDYWIWQPTKLGFLWCDTPPSNFLGWLVTALLILAFITPTLINKSHRKFPPEFFSLATWLLLSLLFLTGAAKHQLWSAVGFIAVTDTVIAALAIRGVRW